MSDQNTQPVQPQPEQPQARTVELPSAFELIKFFFPIVLVIAGYVHGFGVLEEGVDGLKEQNKKMSKRLTLVEAHMSSDGHAGMRLQVQTLKEQFAETRTDVKDMQREMESLSYRSGIICSKVATPGECRR